MLVLKVIIRGDWPVISTAATPDKVVTRGAMTAMLLGLVQSHITWCLYPESISVGPGVKSPDRYDMINWASTPLNPPHAWKIYEDSFFGLLHLLLLRVSRHRLQQSAEHFASDFLII